MEKIGSFLTILFLSINVLSGSAFAADSAEVLIDGKSGKEFQVAVGQQFTYSVVVSSSESGGVGEPRLPDITGFSLIGRSSSVESRSEFVNGKFNFVRRQIFHYRLAPEAVGDYTLSPAEVVVGQQSLRSNSVTVKVVKGVAQPNPSQQLPDEEQDIIDQMDDADALFDQLLRRQLPPSQNIPKINPDEAFFIRVEVDKQKVYVGEQITATWYLYTQNNITNFEPMKYPDLKGFWKEDIELSTRLNFTNSVINGIPYKKALLVSYALFPIKAGTVTIDSYKLRGTAIINSPFGLFGKPYTFTKVNPPVKVEVLPIPAQNQPPDYTGAVGSFDLSASVDRTTVVANEPFALKLRVEGRGNAKQIELPNLNLSEEFEQYDIKSDSKFSKDGTSYKEFEVLLIPRKTGELKIPSVAMSFFNPQTRAFDRKTTEAIALKVVAGKNQIPSSGGGFQLSEKSGPKKLSLPDLVYKEPSFVLNQTLLNKIWILSAVLFLILVGLSFLKEMRIEQDTVVLAKEVQKRFATISKMISEKKLRESAVAAVNLVDYVLSEITSDKEAHQLDILIEKLPPSVLKVLDDKFKENIKFFETLGFAPDELIVRYKNEKLVKEEVRKLKKYLLNAIETFQSSSV